MKKVLIVVLTILFVIEAPSFAEEKNGNTALSKALINDCEVKEGYNNLRLTKCYKKKEVALKEEINKKLQNIYNDTKNLSERDAAEEIINKIKIAQKSWENYVQNHCAYSYVEQAKSHPPSQGLQIIRCRYQKTKERLNEIKNEYKTQH